MGMLRHEKKLVFWFGSYVASQLLLLPLGEENIVSASELKDAQEVVAVFNFLFSITIISSSDFHGYSVVLPWKQHAYGFLNFSFSAESERGTNAVFVLMKCGRQLDISFSFFFCIYLREINSKM